MAYANIPTTISVEAQWILSQFNDPQHTPKMPEPYDIEGWQAVQARLKAQSIAWQNEHLDTSNVSLSPIQLGELSAIDIRPHHTDSLSPVLVFLHGGAYTCFSADSTLHSSVSLALFTGYRVLAVDYPLAPQSHWQNTVKQVAEAIQALPESGVPLSEVVLHGESAGGGLAAGSLLYMKDHGQPLPKGLVLWSPWMDISGAGDSYVTLADDDPAFLWGPHLKPCAAAYTDPKDQKHPYVSPVYGDFHDGFVPTLIQGGTKELLLSDFVRFYQALDSAGVPVKLDLYEAMPHGFHGLLAKTPEGLLARQKSRDFVRKLLSDD